MNPENVVLLFELAKKVSDEADQVSAGKKKQVLMALGQSPAYLLEAIKLLDQKNNRTDRQYKNVAFSGRYYTYNRTIKKKAIR